MLGTGLLQYSKLYNTHEDSAEVASIATELEDKINITSLGDIDRLTPDIVKKAAYHLKNNKTDPSYLYSSDCLKNGPEQLFSHLSSALCSFLVHGHVTTFLLLATLVPIIKDKLGSIAAVRITDPLLSQALF